MVLLNTKTDLAYERRLRQGGDLLLREASAFFAGGGALRQTLHRLVKQLMAEGIPYALLGGLALGEHGYPRLTQDIDVLLSPAGLAHFRGRLVDRGYRPALRQPFDWAQDRAQGKPFEGAQKTFRDSETGVRIEVVTTGEYPGDGLPKPVAFPPRHYSGLRSQRISCSA